MRLGAGRSALAPAVVALWALDALLGLWVSSILARAASRGDDRPTQWFGENDDGSSVGSVQLVLTPTHVRELIETLTKLEAQMVARTTPVGSA
jgi:hypothetical protein